MDDEEYTYHALQEPLYRVETGNYEYRLILRCRQDARVRFATLRSDVLVKLELLDQKHVQDIVQQLQKLISSLAKLHTESYEIIKNCILFPLDVDLSANCSFTYPDPSMSPFQADGEEDDDDEEFKQLAQEAIISLGGGTSSSHDPSDLDLLTSSSSPSYSVLLTSGATGAEDDDFLKNLSLPYPNQSASSSSVSAPSPNSVPAMRGTETSGGRSSFTDLLE